MTLAIRGVKVLVILFFAFVYSLFAFYVLFIEGVSVWLKGVLNALVFIVVSYVCVFSQRVLVRTIESFLVSRTYNRLVVELVQRMRFIFTINDFASLASDFIEAKMDSSVVFYDLRKEAFIYLTQGKVTSDSRVRDRLLSASKDLGDGIYFFDDSFELLRKVSVFARGFMFVYSGYVFVVFNSYVGVFERGVIVELYEEFCSFVKRLETIEKMFQISVVSKEWEIIRDVQFSFLPKVIPQVEGLKMEVYYRPLVNVSGDFYDVIDLGGKVLFVIGDVSGKGLSASLISSITLNVIRFSENKEDLASIIKNVDFSIKLMNFEDKYVTLFLGLVDVASKKLRYVNASIPHPILMKGTQGKVDVVYLNPTLTLIGLIDLPDVIEVREVGLDSGDMLIVATDGLFEATNAQGEEIFDSKEFKELIPAIYRKTPKEAISTIENFLLEYTGSKLRDDVTLLVLKLD